MEVGQEDLDAWSADRPVKPAADRQNLVADRLALQPSQWIVV